MRRFDGAVNWPEMHTYTRKLSYLKFNLQFIQHNIFLPSCYGIKKRAAVRKLFNRSHKSRKTRRDVFTQRISRFSDSRFLCCHLVEIEDVITPHKKTLFKYKSLTEQRIRCRQKCCYLEEERKLIQNEEL